MVAIFFFFNNVHAVNSFTNITNCKFILILFEFTSLINKYFKYAIKNIYLNLEKFDYNFISNFYTLKRKVIVINSDFIFIIFKIKNDVNRKN